MSNRFATQMNAFTSIPLDARVMLPKFVASGDLKIINRDRRISIYYLKRVLMVPSSSARVCSANPYLALKPTNSSLSASAARSRKPSSGWGVSPDIGVWDDPNLLVQGRDPQIERVVEEVMEMLRENPPVMTPAPPLEDRSARGLRRGG